MKQQKPLSAYLHAESGHFVLYTLNRKLTMSPSFMT